MSKWQNIEAVAVEALKDAKAALKEIAEKQSFKVDEKGNPTKERHAPHDGHRAKVIANAADAAMYKVRDAIVADLTANF